MAIDFVHTEQLVDAVLAVLTAHLPAGWLPSTATSSEVALKVLDHGDYADYPEADSLLKDCPAIIIRGLGTEPTDAGIGGLLVSSERLRLVHVRMFEQCRDAEGKIELNMTRARERYAKIIGKAMFTDPKRRLAVIGGGGVRTEVSLASTDTAGAQLGEHRFLGWDLGQDGPTRTEDVATIRQMSQRVWAIACDMVVDVSTGGQG